MGSHRLWLLISLFLMIVIVAGCNSGSDTTSKTTTTPPTNNSSPAGGNAAANHANNETKKEESPKKEMKKVTYTSFGKTTIAWPFLVAEDKGFLKDEAIQLEDANIFDDSQQVQALFGGSIQFVSGGADMMMQAIAKGADLLYVGETVNRIAMGLVGGPDVKSYADMKGKKIGVSSIESSDAYVAKKLLEEKGGLRPEDYTFVQLGSVAARYSALQKGAISAAIITPPTMFDKELNLIGSASEVSDQFAFTSFIVERSWVEKNSDVMIRVLRALHKASKWLNDPANKDEAIQILMNNIQVDREAAEATYEMMVVNEKVFSSEGRPSIESLKSTEQFLLDAGQLSKAGDLESMMDARYFEQAIKE